MDRNVDKWAAEKAKASVVPYVGTWIEMLKRRVNRHGYYSRSLRGNVDRNVHYI